MRGNQTTGTPFSRRRRRHGSHNNGRRRSGCRAVLYGAVVSSRRPTPPICSDLICDRDRHSLDPAWSYSSVTEEESICHWLGIVDLTNLLPLRKSLILSQPRSSLIKPSLKGSWPWSVARMPRQLGATLRPHSWTSIARAFGG